MPDETMNPPVENERQFMPSHKLRQWGPHEPDHTGVEWIILLCPNCEEETRFNSRHNLVVTHDVVHDIKARDFHSLVQCVDCDAVVYVKYHDRDIDPDWYIAYDFHAPTSKSELVQSLGEAKYEARSSMLPTESGN